MRKPRPPTVAERHELRLTILRRELDALQKRIVSHRHSWCELIPLERREKAIQVEIGYLLHNKENEN